jgi:hypothetical protein
LARVGAKGIAPKEQETKSVWQGLSDPLVIKALCGSRTCWVFIVT